MSFTLSFRVQRKFVISSCSNLVYEFLADVIGNLELHPNTSKVESLDHEVYQVVMKRIGTEKYKYQPYYRCKYEFNKNERKVLWAPVDNGDALIVDGALSVHDVGNSRSIVEMDIASRMEIPLPAVLKVAAKKFITADNERSSNKYINNIIAYFGEGEIIY